MTLEATPEKTVKFCELACQKTFVALQEARAAFDLAASDYSACQALLARARLELSIASFEAAE